MLLSSRSSLIDRRREFQSPGMTPGSEAEVEKETGAHITVMRDYADFDDPCSDRAIARSKPSKCNEGNTQRCRSADRERPIFSGARCRRRLSRANRSTLRGTHRSFVIEGRSAPDRGKRQRVLSNPCRMAQDGLSRTDPHLISRYGSWPPQMTRGKPVPPTAGSHAVASPDRRHVNHMRRFVAAKERR